MGGRTILGYCHQVRPRAADGLGLGVAPETIVGYARYLRGAGYALRTVSQSMDESEGKAAALTFDDGYADNLQYALPALASVSAVATLYVVASEVGRDRPSWMAKAVPGADRLLTAAELVELQQAGWEIGSHCLTHARLPALRRDQQWEELRGSKARLEDMLGRPVVSLAYPYGEYSELTCELVEEAGYRNAVTTAKRGGGASPFTIVRQSMGGYGMRAAKQLLKLKLAVARQSWKG